MTTLRVTALATALFMAASAGCSDDSTGNEHYCGDGTCDPDENGETCPDDCGNPCGDGVADPGLGEECDGEDLRGMTCLEAANCNGGTLGCLPNCRFDISACEGCSDDCGDGVAGGYEECDATDLKGMTCLDVGCVSGTLACTDTCTYDRSGCTNCEWCGNGIVDAEDECDCGLDPENLPQGCTAVNGDPLGECTADCLVHSCDQNLWDPNGCDTDLPDDQCCPDEWGNPAICMPWGTFSAYCVLSCTSTADCHYNSMCLTSEGGCMTYICGPSGFPNSGHLNSACFIPGGGTGYCAPTNLAEERIGLCYENGGLDQHDECEPYTFEVSFPRNQPGLDVCNQGFCDDLDQDGIYRCVKFCNWMQVYDQDANTQACGAGYNCFADIHFDLTASDSQRRSKRSADLAFCVPTEATDPQYGQTTCDMVNGQLISDRASSCADVNAAYTCELLPFGGPTSNLAPGGSLIGVCQDSGGATPTKTLWQICVDGVDICPQGSRCMKEDFCAAATGDYRCVPYCDTEDPVPCGQQHAAVPDTNVCHSLSTYYRSGFTACSTDDASPTRLGLCALP